MAIRAVEFGLAIPDRVAGEPITSPAQRQKMLELGLSDYKLVGSLGRWQANAVLDQLRAISREEQDAKAAARRREDRARAGEVAFTLLGLLATLSMIWFLPRA